MYINGYEMIKFEDFIVHKKVYLQYTLSNKGNIFSFDDSFIVSAGGE